jgi:hypothetical protein
VKPAARAIEKKLRDSGRDLGAEYNEEKAKERFN